MVGYAPVMLTYFLGKPTLFVSDPDLLEAMHKDKTVMQKDGAIGKYVMPPSVTNFLFTMNDGPDQLARRKEMIHMFTGKANFKLLDRTIDKVL